MSHSKPVALSNLLSTMVALLCLSPLAGCRICAEGEDMDYPGYGGSWQRTTRNSGRVGSVFDSAGGKVAQLTDRREPLPADAAERKRHGLRTEGMFDPEEEDSETNKPEGTDEPPATDADSHTRSLDSIPEGSEDQDRLDEINVPLERSELPAAFVR